jgi:hypothetical protein
MAVDVVFASPVLPSVRNCHPARYYTTMPGKRVQLLDVNALDLLARDSHAGLPGASPTRPSPTSSTSTAGRST